MKTLRVTVVEDLVERTTIDIRVAGDFDLKDGTPEMNDFLEGAFIEGDYKEVPNTKEYNIDERYFIDPEVLP